jgi:reactive intermediate/imine deaminase
LAQRYLGSARHPGAGALLCFGVKGGQPAGERFIDACSSAPTSPTSATPRPWPSFPRRRPPPSAPIRRPVQAGNTVYISGQIGLDPATMQMVEGIDAQITRVFDNLKAVAAAAGGSLADAVKVNIYLTDLANFAKVNEAMAKLFQPALPGARRGGVAALPRGALVEVDAVLVLD